MRILFKTKSAIVISLTVLLVVSGCDRSVYTENPEHARSEQAVSAKAQSERSRVMEAFALKPDAAFPTYRKKWSDHATVPNKRDDKVTTITMLAIAGELIRRDAKNYDEYYRYILSHLDEKDWEIAAVAIGALSDARGTESIGFLFDRLDDSNSMIVAEAATVLEYRYRTAKYEPSLSNDAELIKARSKVMCDAKPTNKHVRQYCQENNF